MAPKAWYVLTHESRSEMDADTTSALDYEEYRKIKRPFPNGLFHRPRPPTLASPPPGRARGAPRHRAPPRVAGHGQDGWLGTGCQRGWGGWRQGKISIAVLLCGLGNKLKARSLNFGRHPGRGFDGETRLTGKAMMWDKAELPR
jgi:hypothetical protein